jgi:hypothetical protein
MGSNTVPLHFKIISPGRHYAALSGTAEALSTMLEIVSGSHKALADGRWRRKRWLAVTHVTLRTARLRLAVCRCPTEGCDDRSPTHGPGWARSDSVLRVTYAICTAECASVQRGGRVRTAKVLLYACRHCIRSIAIARHCTVLEDADRSEQLETADILMVCSRPVIAHSMEQLMHGM